MSSETERKAFEAHFQIALDLSKDEDGDYINDKTIGAWGGWKAASRRAAQAAEPPRTVEYHECVANGSGPCRIGQYGPKGELQSRPARS